MSLDLRNLEWLRRIQVPDIPAFGQRLYEMFSDTKRGVETLEQQTNSSLQGQPGAPPQPQGITVIPHPMGVDVSIQHEGEFYQDVRYHVDYSRTPYFQDARTHDLGQSRNGVIPVGPWTGYYQVRALYPNGQSSPPVPFGGSAAKPVAGASVSQAILLPSEGAGTTRRGQPPGFGGPFRSQNGAPPVRRGSK